MNIGFDLDRIFINYPPLIPSQLIDWLYKQSLREILSLKRHNSKTLSYNIPHSWFAKTIRQISHIPLLRPPIKQNINFIHTFSNHTHQLHLISSRFGFLQNLTYYLLNKYQLSTPFSSINLNLHDMQPHLFKEKIIKEKMIQLFVDDDLELLKYLQTRCPDTKLLWYNPYSRKTFTNGIVTITNLDEVTKYLT